MNDKYLIKTHKDCIINSPESTVHWFQCAIIKVIGHLWLIQILAAFHNRGFHTEYARWKGVGFEYKLRAMKLKCTEEKKTCLKNCNMHSKI